ncbi:MBOAT, membrane-bound O-acyltransferase family-domain-containing protein [Entophlyctis helioformis]|nr:MBOAT, membrane-bound O-acyltransferase family-domain-containing protein [Entophlyctis helioformis]
MRINTDADVEPLLPSSIQKASNTAADVGRTVFSTVEPTNMSTKAAEAAGITSPSRSKRIYGAQSLPRLAIYPVALGTMVAISYWSYRAYLLSVESHPNFSMYGRRLSRGWLFGRSIDNSDGQYGSFRNNIPVLVVVMLAHVGLSLLLQIRTSASPTTFRSRVMFALVFSAVFLTALYGLSVLKILAICSVNYAAVKAIGPRWQASAFAWIWGIGILFANDAFRGYKFGALIPGLGWMDGLNGIGMRWHISFNFTMLRMVSFATDYAWRSSVSPRQFEKHRTDCSICASGTGELCPRGRIECPQHDSEFNMVNYFAYLFYAPLFMAGPIITFNDFMAQMQRPPKSITLRSVLVAGGRWIANVLLMEVVLHLFYVVAIKDAKAWEGYESMDVYALGYWNLKIVWLKLMIIWRFFRLWALADGLDTVENMTRCMSNNYSAMGFWRAWHRSYNRWLVRYLYVPLGGAKYYLLNLLVTFTFVAVWHDIELRLLAWGWLIAAFIVPEILATRFFCTDAWRQALGPFHIHLCAVGAVLNIMLMMFANIVGFVIGDLSGFKEIARELYKSNFREVVDGLTVIPGLFLAAHWMFYIRAHEKGRGKD